VDDPVSGRQIRAEGEGHRPVLSPSPQGASTRSDIFALRAGRRRLRQKPSLPQGDKRIPGPGGCCWAVQHVALMTKVHSTRHERSTPVLQRSAGQCPRAADTGTRRRGTVVNASEASDPLDSPGRRPAVPPAA
jgi:hypothetical protein